MPGEDPPLLDAVGDRRDDRVGVLRGRTDRHAATAEVGALQPVAHGEHVVGELRGGAAEEVHGDDELEVREGLAQPLLAGHRHDRVAADHDERAQRVVLGVHVLGHQVGGDVAPRVAHRPDGRVEEPIRELVEPLGRRSRPQEPAARAREVAGDQVDHLQQPVDERALATHVPAGAHVRDRGGRGGEVAAVRRMSSADSPVTEATESASNGAMNSRRPSTLRACRAQHVVVPTAEPVDLGEQRGEQIGVGVGLDLQVVAEPHLDRADAARVHEGDVAAALADAADGFDRVGHRDRGEVAPARVAAEAQEVVGVVQVGRGEHRLDAEDRVHRRELVRQILRQPAEQAGRLHLPPERVDGRDARRRVRERVAPVAADRFGAVLATDLAQPLADVGERLVPRDLLELAPTGSDFGLTRRKRVVEPVGIVVHRAERRALVTREAARDRMVAVGMDGDDRAVARRSRPPTGRAVRRSGNG